MSKAIYKLVGLRRDGSTVEQLNLPRPTDAKMCAWGKRRGCVMVFRYWPSKKGWTALNIHNAQEFVRTGRLGRYSEWTGAVRGTRVYPTEDAAVMHVLAILNSQPTLV